MSINTQQLSFVPFDQSSDVIIKLDPIQHKTLYSFNNKYMGLCELICNRILIDSDLGQGRDVDFLKNRVTIERLNEKKITDSHLLDVYSLFSRVIAFLFGIFPDNIFSIWDQWKLIDSARRVNEVVLSKGLSEIQNGETLKLEVFQQKCFDFVGHSLLLKKIGDNNYIFFDPNHGEYRDVPFSELCNKINDLIQTHQATNIFITKGSDFLDRLS